MRHFSFLAAAACALFAANVAPAAAGQRDMAAALQGRIVRLEGGRLVPTRLPPQTRYVAFYFGASWCGPCRAFVPELRQRYARLRAAGAPVEIVFVSDDAGCGAMTDYIRTARMPWPSVACGQRDRLGWLRRARGAALPGLLVYDRAGPLLVTSWTRAGHSAPRRAADALERLGTR